MLHPMGMIFELWEGFKVLDPLFNNALKTAYKYNCIILGGIREEIKKHRDTIDYDSEPRDYIDAFLMEQQRQKADVNGYGEWSDRQLIGAVGDLFAAGMETTSTTIRQVKL